MASNGERNSAIQVVIGIAVIVGFAAVMAASEDSVTYSDCVQMQSDGRTAFFSKDTDEVVRLLGEFKAAGCETILDNGP